GSTTGGANGSADSTAWTTISQPSKQKDPPMAKIAETSLPQMPPVRVSRTLHAPRELVFQAWSSADHVKRWFAPTGYTVPQATVDMRVGGAFEVLMRAPDGVEHWVRGVFVEITPNERLELDLIVYDDKRNPLFRAMTEARFADALGGTRLEVTQGYLVLDPKAAWMAEGAPEGWSQTLDKLSAEVLRMLTSPEGPRSVVHSAFTLERTYDAPVERVYRALSDEAAKAKWFAGSEGQWRQNERIVYSYEMWLDEKKISVSLATMQIKAAGPARATLKVTEQGAFLDGYDDGGSRERGTGFLLDKLGASLT